MFFAIKLTNLKTNNLLSLVYRLGQINTAIIIDCIDKFLIQNVQILIRVGNISECKQGQDWICNNFEFWRVAEFVRDLTRPIDVIADTFAQILQTVTAQQKPNLQRAKTPSQRNGPFGIIDQSVLSMRFQIFGLNGQRTDQIIRIAQEMR